MNYTIKTNTEFKSKELYFEDIPDKKTRDQLKELRFRFNKFKVCWYGYATVEAIEKICGKSSEPAPVTTPVITPVITPVAKDEKTATKKEATATYAGVDPEKLYKLLTDNKELIAEPVYTDLLHLATEALAIKAEKQAGRKANIRSAVKKFLGKDNSRPALEKAHMFTYKDEEYFAYCDGFKMCWSKNDFGFGVNDKADTLNVNALIDNYQVKSPVNIPVTADFKTALQLHLKTTKKGSGFDRMFVIEYTTAAGTFKAAFNPDYLKACIDFTDAKTIKAPDKKANSPIFFEGDNDRFALCLPVRITGDEPANYTVNLAN